MRVRTGDLFSVNLIAAGAGKGPAVQILQLLDCGRRRYQLKYRSWRIDCRKCLVQIRAARQIAAASIRFDRRVCGRPAHHRQKLARPPVIDADRSVPACERLLRSHVDIRIDRQHQVLPSITKNSRRSQNGIITDQLAAKRGIRRRRHIATQITDHMIGCPAYAAVIAVMRALLVILQQQLAIAVRNTAHA